MKLSLNWIKDFVKIPDDMDLSKLAYDLTMSTVEVEGAESLLGRLSYIANAIVEIADFIATAFANLALKFFVCYFL